MYAPTQLYTNQDSTTRSIQLSCSLTPGKFKVTTFKAISWFSTGITAGTDNFDKPAAPSTAYFYSGGCNCAKSQLTGGWPVSARLLRSMADRAALVEQGCPTWVSL